MDSDSDSEVEVDLNILAGSVAGIVDFGPAEEAEDPEEAAEEDRQRQEAADQALAHACQYGRVLPARRGAVRGRLQT